LWEEIYGGDERGKRPSPALRHDWYFDAEPAIGWFETHKGAFDLELVSFGVNAATLTSEAAILLAVRDVSYAEDYAETVASWEEEKEGRLLLSTKDSDGIRRVLTEEPWAGESLFAFVQGLRRLKAIAPWHVRLPEIALQLR
jgi:hypothetical protein